MSTLGPVVLLTCAGVRFAAAFTAQLPMRLVGRVLFGLRPLLPGLVADGDAPRAERVRGEQR